jgi:hypothetical protein
MEIIFSPEAGLEFEEAKRYCQRQAAYPSKEFRREVSLVGTAAQAVTAAAPAKKLAIMQQYL